MSTSTKVFFQADLATEEVLSEIPALTSFSVALANAAFTSVAGPITFRIYTYVPMGGQVVYYDNILVLGTVVPLPVAPLVKVSGKKKITTTKTALTIKGTAHGRGHSETGEAHVFGEGHRFVEV